MTNEELADLDGGPLPQGNESTFSLIEEGLKNNPHGLATIVMHQSADHLSELTTNGEDPTKDKDVTPSSTKCLQWTYTQLHRAALKFAVGLMAHGIQPGMRIATLIPNRVEYPLTLWMTFLLRLTLISLDPGAVTLPRREELAKLIESTNPDIVMILDEEGVRAIDEVFSSRPPPKIKILLEGTADGWTSIPALVYSGISSSIDPNTIVAAARGPDTPSRPSLLLFTSGTSTGQPKGCPRSVASTNHSLYNRFQWGQGFTPSSVILTSSPNFRIIAPAIHASLWRAGATGITPDPILGPPGTIAAIREHRISYVVFIPALLYAVVTDRGFDALDVSSVKEIVLGGDMITRDHHIRTRAAFPQAEVATAHGMTEGGGLFKWDFWNTPLSGIPFYGEISPLGSVTPGSRLRIIDPQNTGKVLRRNEPGELCVSSTSVIPHYLTSTNADPFFTSDDGVRWFRTGDLGMINTSRQVYILGRIKDVIKRSGIPITPAALEGCIEKFTGSQTCVVAWPHAVLGQEPLVVAKGLGGRRVEEVKRRVVEMFGKDYAVGEVLTLEQLGQKEFPLNATGKIMKREVVEMVKGYLERKS